MPGLGKSSSAPMLERDAASGPTMATTFEREGASGVTTATKRESDDVIGSTIASMLDGDDASRATSRQSDQNAQEPQSSNDELDYPRWPKTVSFYPMYPEEDEDCGNRTQLFPLTPEGLRLEKKASRVLFKMGQEEALQNSRGAGQGLNGYACLPSPMAPSPWLALPGVLPAGALSQPLAPGPMMPGPLSPQGIATLSPHSPAGIAALSPHSPSAGMSSTPQSVSLSPHSPSAGIVCNNGEKTTVMWRNIPNNYSRNDLLELIDAQGFSGSYDFFYAPFDFTRNALVGYAFINFVCGDEANRFYDLFQDFSNWSVMSSKVSVVTWSNALQGLAGHVERYRNSPVMHPDVPEEKRPLLFQGGQVVPFPPPTKKLRAPYLKDCRAWG